MNLVDILASSTPSEAEYYAQDPFYNVGRNVLQMQAPRATNDAEAWLGPLAQGLIGGGLLGYGRQNASQAAFEDAKKSPFLAPYLQEAQFIGPRPEGEEVAALPESLAMYLQEEAPEGFSPNKAKQSILSTLLQQQQAQDLAMKEMELEAQRQDKLLPYSAMAREARIAEARGIEEAKAEINRGAGGFKTEDIAKDVTATANRNQSIKFVEDQIQVAKKQNDKGLGILGAVTENIPFVGVPTAEKQTLDAIGEAMVGQVDKIQGRETNSDARKRLIDQFGPKAYDSDAEIDRKGKAFIEYLKSISPATPALQAKGLTDSSATSPQYEIRTGPDGKRYKVLLGQ